MILVVRSDRLRKCLTMVRGGVTVGSSSPAVFAAPSTSPDVEHVRIGGLRPWFVPSSQTTSWLSDGATSRPRTDNPIGLRFGLRPGADPTVHDTSNHHAATAIRLSEVDASGDALSAPITVNNNGIDARNGQAYHGRKTTTTNGTRPAVARSRAGKGIRGRRYRCRCFAPCIRSSAGAPGRT